MSSLPGPWIHLRSFLWSALNRDTRPSSQNKRYLSTISIHSSVHFLHSFTFSKRCDPSSLCYFSLRFHLRTSLRIWVEIHHIEIYVTIQHSKLSSVAFDSSPPTWDLFKNKLQALITNVLLLIWNHAKNYVAVASRAIVWEHDRSPRGPPPRLCLDPWQDVLDNCALL